ncbi:hypothetical protein N7470_006489 [Penicillium chermesinum]|nr:hypothetical protein N7470_006489 [Penicillium chermesinum]
MCPEISSLVRTLTYPLLEDGENTKNRPEPRGLSDRVIFFNHQNLEESLSGVSDRRDEGAKQSKQNLFEAEVVLKIVKYLGQQGYGTDKLVVLTPYLGQLSLLRQTLSKQNDPVLNDLDSYDLVQAGLLSHAAASHSKRPIKLSTIDNYQGEESEIVIASLTRSNKCGDIGFMATPERLNVLLSRARSVLIMVGNSQTFVSSRKGQRCWRPLIDQLKDNGHLYDGLPVQCEQHPDKTAVLRTMEDFDREVPDGGCSAPCDITAKNPPTFIIFRLTLFVLKVNEVHQDRQMDMPPWSYIVFTMLNGQGFMPLLDVWVDAERKRVLEQHRDEIKELQTPQSESTTGSQSGREKVPMPIEPGPRPSTPQGIRERGIRSDNPSDDPSVKPEAREIMPKKSASKAKADWDYQKLYFNSQSPEIDALMDMVGLESVKSKFLTMKAKVDIAVKQNVDLGRERFGTVLLGNPGTGKTTVARLYAKFLAAVGIIPGHTFIETTGSKLSNEGVSQCQKTIEQLLKEGGGVMFIDEAYQMVQSSNFGGHQVLDFLLAEVENLTGKIVFVLAGYQRPMEKFFAHNPGLPSRFPHELKFEDFDDSELMMIIQKWIENTWRMQMKVDGGLDGLYCRIVARRIGRRRGREGFANARAVENAMAKITERQTERLMQQRRHGDSQIDDFFLHREDLIGPDPSQNLKSSKAWQKLQSMIGLAAVKSTVESLIDTVQYNYRREILEQPVVGYSLNKVFLGNPGTGKTSVAKIYGQILVDMGLLSNGEVVVKNPSDFVGSVIGESEKNTKGILAATLGKVLVIDEAYGLFAGGTSDGTGTKSDPYRGAAVDTIVADVQSIPGDDQCVLLLGYKDQMEQMFQNVNPGLSRRFPIDQAFIFEDFTAHELDLILDLRLVQQGYGITDQARLVVLEMLERARNRPHFEKSENSVAKMFEGVVGCESIISTFEGYRQLVRNIKALEMDPREQVPFNFVFRGPPSTARKMGQIYYDLGLLSSNEVIEASATELVGQYVGHTGPKTQKMLERGLGKVLFIDEAYRLAEGHFAKEAIDELVDCITKPRFSRKLIIILAGYDADINRLMSMNPGLTSRFPESIQFRSLSARNCIQLLKELLERKKVVILNKSRVDFDITCLYDLDSDLTQKLTDGFDKLSKTSSWANARDIETLVKAIFGETLKKLGTFGVSNLVLNGETVLGELEDMINERHSREQFQKQCSAKDQNLGKVPSLRIQSSDPPTRNIESQSLISGMKPNSRAGSPVQDQKKQQVPVPQRDAGVTDDDWNKLQKAKEAAEKKENYLQMIEKEEVKQKELLRLKEEGQAVRAAEEAKEQQNEELRKRLEQEQLQLEIERRRQEAITRELETRRKDLAEARRKEQAIQVKLRSMGVCVQGYKWIKLPGGYRCAGGSHWVADAQL